MRLSSLPFYVALYNSTIAPIPRAYSKIDKDVLFVKQIEEFIITTLLVNLMIRVADDTEKCTCLLVWTNVVATERLETTSLRDPKKSNKSKTYEQIVNHVRSAISSGELSSGDRLPPESELAKSLGVSRPTVREALKVLEALNILRSSTGPKGGTFVRNITGLEVADYLKDSISLLLDVDELSLQELWAARETIDVPAAGMAAVRRTEHDLFVIEQTIEADELKCGDSIISDISFHRAVAEASQNRMLSLFMSSIYMTLRSLSEKYILPEDMLLEVKRTSQKAHRLIYEAIVAQDATLARDRMQEHLRLAYGVYTQAVPRSRAKYTLGEPSVGDSDTEAI